MSSSVSSSNGKVALITGITGQDGSYLTELLIEKGYTVRVSPREHVSEFRNFFGIFGGLY
jgi:GDP-D-mannose dehydratase